MARRFAMLLMLLVCCATPATLAQTTQPAPAATDRYADTPLPTRRTGAAPTTQSTSVASQSSTDPLDTRRLGLALLIVLGAMFVAYQVWKRLGMPGGVTKNTGALQVVSRMVVGPKQQLMLVRVGRRCVLVGNNGTQMTPLCEIGDPDEVAGLLGQSVAEGRESITSSFNAVLGGESRRFDDEIETDLAAHEAHAAEEAQALSATRDELSGMMEKVRGLSRQFSGGGKGQ